MALFLFDYIWLLKWGLLTRNIPPLIFYYKRRSVIEGLLFGWVNDEKDNSHFSQKKNNESGDSTHKVDQLCSACCLIELKQSNILVAASIC